MNSSHLCISHYACVCMRVCVCERERERESDRRLLVLGRAAHVHTHLGEAECVCVILPGRAVSVNAFSGAQPRTRHTTHASTCACTHRLTRAQIPWSGPAQINLTCDVCTRICYSIDKRINDVHTCIHAHIYTTYTGIDTDTDTRTLSLGPKHQADLNSVEDHQMAVVGCDNLV